MAQNLIGIGPLWKNGQTSKTIKPNFKSMCHCINNNDTIIGSKAEVSIINGSDKNLRRGIVKSGSKVDPCGIPKPFRSNFTLK